MKHRKYKGLDIDDFWLKMVRNFIEMHNDAVFVSTWGNFEYKDIMKNMFELQWGYYKKYVDRDIYDRFFEVFIYEIIKNDYNDIEVKPTIIIAKNLFEDMRDDWHEDTDLEKLPKVISVATLEDFNKLFK